MMSPGRRRSHAHIRRGVLCWSTFRLGPWLYLRITSTTAPPTNASWDAGVEPRNYGQARQRPKRAEKVAKIVGKRMKLEPHVAFLDPLVARPALIVEGDDLVRPGATGW